MRTFTAFLTLLLALLFTSQVLANPVLEVSILDISQFIDLSVDSMTPGSSELQQRYCNHILAF